GKPHAQSPKRQVTLLQRKVGTPGRGLGKTTGWIHRASLQAHQVRMLGGVTYEKITPDAVHILRDGVSEVIPADTVVICAGQVSVVALGEIKCHIIGGAKLAGELDAKRAIDEGTRLGALL
ncbi:MAG: NADPH-dependent 2,4-dienoyl-CoA reductase, partial [Deltaproteobacteria bacterium]